MRRLWILLPAICLLAALCACGGGTAQPQTQDMPAALPAESTAPTPASEAIVGDYDFEDGLEMTEAEIAVLDAAYSVVPDLSGLTEEEILARYKAGSGGDGTFSAYEAAMFSPELFEGAEDYPREDGEWTDYDPGDWAPGEDVVAEFDIDWDAEYGDSGRNAAGLPEEYAFLMPEGLRDGDLAMEEDGEFILRLAGRTKDDYSDKVRLAKDAGYTQGANEIDTMGIVMYEASNGQKGITLMFQNGTILASFS